MPLLSRFLSLALDEERIVLTRSIGTLGMRDLLSGWQKIVLQKPERINYSVINDLTEWSGLISEADVREIIEWSAQTRQGHDVPAGKLGKMALIGRAGAGINLLSDMFTALRAERSFHASTPAEAWQLVLPDIPMPNAAKTFFAKRHIL
ncbi:MAG TPA: hypothetical protein HPP80_08025 [Rhodospirillaceae bacterium]|nr:hypothetical protein [Rhodospirillaceae bacterium]